MAKVEPEPEFGVDGEELLERDCYGTTRELIDLHDLTFGHSPTLDPFFDPESPVKAGAAISIRESDARDANFEEGLGPVFVGSAYREDWSLIAVSGGALHNPTVLANPPYSGGHLAKAHRKISLEVRAGMRGIRVCPFSPGTIYWKRYVLPIFSAIACIGRHGFIALRDMRDAKPQARRRRTETPPCAPAPPRAAPCRRHRCR